MRYTSACTHFLRYFCLGTEEFEIFGRESENKERNQVRVSSLINTETAFTRLGNYEFSNTKKSPTLT